MSLVVMEHPPFFVFRRVGAARAEDFEVALERLRALLASSPQRCIAIYDAGEDPTGSPDGHARRACAEWIARNEPLLRSKLIGLEFAAKSPLSRGVLTAIFWMRKPPFETYFHSNVRAAIADAAQRCRSAIAPPELLVELDEAMRRAA